MREWRGIASWTLTVLAVLALAAGGLLLYVRHTVFREVPFADRAAAALETDRARDAVAGKLTDAIVRAKPDLVAVRPLIAGAADHIVASEAFRSLVRRAALEVHRAAFDRHRPSVTARVRDAGLLVGDALRTAHPDLAARVPAGAQTKVLRVSAGIDGALLRVSEHAQRARRLELVAFLAAFVLGALALAVTRPRRAWPVRLALVVGVVGGVGALGFALAPRVLAASASGADRAAIRAAASPWLDALVRWGTGACFAGLAVVLIAVRPSPRAIVTAAGAAALAALAAGATLAALAVGGTPAAPAPAGCNGSPSLCGRRLDQVALLGTHNSMAAIGEPGWLFPAQDAGIAAQLHDGVRALLVDTHYGLATDRGVLTDLEGETKSRGKLDEAAGPQFVAVAKRARERLLGRPTGKRDVYLCHAFCEVGATRAADAFDSVHRFLVRHPDEVVVLSIEDDTSAADTAAVLRRSGLSDEVYLGGAGRPWPTLAELVARDERVVVLAENHPGGAPWIHPQFTVAQETPYRFGAPGELVAEGSCRANRGGTKGSLLLVNHWVDTSPAPRVTIAKEVNALPFLDGRLERCRHERDLLPNVVAVDFYREGATNRAVDQLNRVSR